MHSIGFPLRAIKPEWKLALKIPRYYVSLQTKGSVCWSEQNTLRQVENFKYIVVVFTSNSRSKQTNGWIAKNNAVLHELYRSVVTKRESSTAKLSVFKSVFVPILTYVPESWVMSEIISRVQTAERDFCDESVVWHFATKCAAVKVAEPWMWNHISSELREHRYQYICFGHVSRIPTKDWRGKSSWLNQRKRGSEVIQGLGLVTTSPTLLGLVLVWSQQNYLKLLLAVRYSKPS